MSAASCTPGRGLLRLSYRMACRQRCIGSAATWEGPPGHSGNRTVAHLWRPTAVWRSAGSQRIRTLRHCWEETGAYSASASTSDSSEASSPSSYWTLAKEHQRILEAKKSKFVCTAWPIQTGKEAMELIQSHKDPTVSHNCFAYKAGSEYRSSDDGEPGGTAGRPMLAALEGEGLDYVCVMVTRYYGGTKLGAGGLVRAYGGAVRECLRDSPRELVTAKAEVRFDVPFEMIGSCYVVLDKHQGLRLQEDYSENGATVTARVEANQVDSLTRALQDVTSGAVELQVL